MSSAALRSFACSHATAVGASSSRLAFSRYAAKRLLDAPSFRMLPTLPSTHFSRPLSTVKFTFVDADGDYEEVEAEEGDTLLDIAHDNDIELEGACGGEMACSTCHVILEEAVFDALEEAEEEEEDMLDLALGLTDTSRLGCQVCVDSSMSGMKVTLPAEANNMQ